MAKKIFLFLLTPIILFLFMVFYFNITVFAFETLKLKVVTLVLLIMILIHIFLMVVTGDTKKSTVIECIVLWILLFINSLRYIYTSEPITFSDFLYTSGFGNIVSIVKNTILQVIWRLVPVFASLAVVLSILVSIAKKNNIIIYKNKKARIALGIISGVIILILFFPTSFMKNFILKNIYERGKDIITRYTYNYSYYSEESLLGGMYAKLLESKISEPNNYNTEDMANILDNCEYDNENNLWEKSNIIVTFSESFFDVGVLEDDIKFTSDVVPNFNRLKNEGIFVNMISPTYGGISANVEFEFLTGYSLNYFGKGYTPFMQLYRSGKYNNAQSLIKQLNNNGYYTKVVFGKDYFSSSSVYSKLGIYEYEEKDVKSEYKGYYTSDEYLMDETIETFNNKKDNEKIFYMNCTIQSHTPYYKEKYENYDIEIESSTLNPDVTEMVYSYAQGCYDADKQLERMYEYIQTLDEPTILIFFGDHLPYLLDEKTGKCGIDYLSYYNTDDELLNTYRMYNTQALVLSNFNMDKPKNVDYLSPDMLLNMVLNNMDIELSDYYKWLYSVKDKLPSSNYIVSEDVNGDLYWTDSLEGEMKETSDLKEKMQYYMLTDK